MDFSDTAKVRRFIFSYGNIFRIGLSSGSPSKIPFFRTDPLSSVILERMRFRIYSLDKRDVLAGMFSKLIHMAMVYSNLTLR